MQKLRQRTENPGLGTKEDVSDFIWKLNIRIMTTVFSFVFVALLVGMTVTTISISCHILLRFFCWPKIKSSNTNHSKQSTLPLESPSFISKSASTTTTTVLPLPTLLQSNPSSSPSNSPTGQNSTINYDTRYMRSRSTSNNNISTSADKEEKQESLPYIKYSTILCVLLFTITLIFITIHHTSDLFINEDHHIGNDTFHQSFAWVIYLFWYSGRILLLSVFILRLYITFNDTVFAYSRKTFLCLVICTSFMPIFAIVSILIYAIIRKLFFIGIMAASLFMVTDISISCTLLYLFLHKLFQLMTGGETAQVFIKVMTKFTLLYVLSFVSSMMICMGFMMIPVSRKIFNMNTLYLLMAFDSWSNIICIWLKLPFNLFVYHKICQCCSDKCFALCYYLAKKSKYDENNLVLSVIESNSAKSRTGSKTSVVQISNV